MVLLRPETTVARAASTRVVVMWGQKLFRLEVVYSAVLVIISTDNLHFGVFNGCRQSQTMSSGKHE